MSIAPSNQSWLNKSFSKTDSLVGKDVLGFCRKCGENRRHTVLSVGVGNAPERVLCNTCKGEKKFRPPQNESDSRRGEGKVTDYSEEGELDIDSIDVEEVLAAKDPDKARAKSKSRRAPKKAAKPRVAKVKVDKNQPLSMLDGPSREDLTLFENKTTAFKVSGQPPRPYMVSERFTVGDTIDHKAFGLGFVVNEVGMNKIEVLFEKGRKLLITGPRT